MTTAIAQMTFKSTLTKEAKKSIQLSPKLTDAIKESMTSGKDIVVQDQAETFVIRPMHPIVEGGKGYGEFEDVYILLITGFQSYKIPKGTLA